MGKIVAIVGRPNVGKSTLFNRLVGMREAIVDEVSGVTRDRNYGRSDWNGKYFSVVDTGGYIIGSDDVFESEIRKQVELAIDEADIILFLVDTIEGLTPMDEDVAELLRRSRKPVHLIANKVDNNALHADAQEFYRLGLGYVWPVSSINGHGTGDLLDAVVESMEPEPDEETPELPRIAVVGRPNVGKSSMINSLLETDRHIVTDVPGTTRDSIYTRYQRFNFDFILVDTAGLRKKSKVYEDIEYYSVMRSVRAIEHSDVCILMIDATSGIESQDLSILQLIEKNGKGVVIAVNKWDLIAKDNHTMDNFRERILERIAPFTDIPITFISVKDRQRVLKVLENAVMVYHNRIRKISTSRLNEDLLPIISDTPPPAYRGTYIKIKYITQLPKHTPAFVFFCNYPQQVKDPYKRFIENQIRSKYDFSGVPLQIFFRKK
jgi:GTP-binding protein